MKFSQSRPLIIVLVVNFIGMFAYSIVLPLLPYYAATFNANPMQVGIIFSIYSLFQFFATPVIGRLSDYQGRRLWLFISLLGTSCGFACMAIANSYWFLILGRAIDGISGGNLSVAQAYIGDNTKPEERTRVYSLLVTTQGLGAIVGPLMSAYLVRYGYSTAMWGAAAFSIAAAMVVAVLLPDTNRRTVKLSSIKNFRTPTEPLLRPNTKQFHENTELYRLYFVASGCAVVFGGMSSTITQYMQLRLNFLPQDTGNVLSFFGIVILVYQFVFSGFIAKKWNDRRLIFAGLGMLSVAATMVGTAWSFASMLVCVALYGCSMTTIRSSLASLISRSAGVSNQGMALGLLQSINSLAQVFAPIFFGGLMSYISLSAPGIFGGGIVLCLIIWMYINRKSNEASQP